VRYVHQMKKNLISVEILEAHGLEFTGRDMVLKVLKGSTDVLKGVKNNNLYYLKVICYRAIGNFSYTDDDSTRL